MSTTEKDLHFREWKENPTFPSLEGRQLQHARVFVQRVVTGDGFKNDKYLYAHQKEAILRVIYEGEIGGKWSSLLDIVTGGGKTAIIAGLISYLWQVRDVEHFLIVTPNKIVRERIFDAFDKNSSEYVYEDFIFFFNSNKRVKDTLTAKTLKNARDAQGLHGVNIIITNIHQLYENKQSQALEIMLSEGFTDKLAIFNDEAHNTGAKQYREVLKLLKSIEYARIDLTATVYRLDRELLDTYPPVYTYGVQQAIRDRTVKQIVATKPDIESVKMTYEEIDENDKVIRKLDVQEVPWDTIEAELRKSGAVRFVTSKNARIQQLKIGKSCIDYQIKQVPILDNEPCWNPLWMIIALSLKDAERVYETLKKSPFKYKDEEILLAHSKQEDVENKKAFLLGRKSSKGLKGEDKRLWEEAQKVRVIIGVSMLREGWDVRNIAVITLFRKFSYTTLGGQVHSVYGQQIIGRGMRRIRKRDERDFLFVVDHPAFDHDWLWEMLSADVYKEHIIPGEEIKDELMKEIDLPSSVEEDGEEVGEPDPDFNIDEIIDGLPEVIEIEPIDDWERYFKNLQFETKRTQDGVQKITGLKHRYISNEMTEHEIPDDEINREEVVESADEKIKKMSDKELVAYLEEELNEMPYSVLHRTFRNVDTDELQKMVSALNWILREKFGFTIAELEEADRKKLDEIEFFMDQIIHHFEKPEIVKGIVGKE